MGRARTLLLVALATTTASAGPAADEAERLFQEGNRAARRQRWPQALAAWQASEALVPAWQPAFNQATVLVFTGQPLAAWAACGRALEREPPADRRAQVEAECGAIEAKLLASYAAIALEVAPADAVVRLDGAPWLPPRRALVARDASELVVERPGFLPQTLTWRHPIGQRSRQAIALVPEPPAAPPSAAPPSAAPVAAVAPPSAAPVAAVAPPSAAPRPPVAAAVTAPPIAGGPDPAWKWVAWGSGAALVGASALLLADADELRTPRVFRVESADAEAAWSSRRDTGLALAAGGGLALVVGAALWWLEDAP
ncbi:MAG: hypothetical protein R3F60_19175 [bacterium]